MKYKFNNGDILGARTDIFNENGKDMFPAGKVLIKGNRKSMLNSAGDIFNNSTGSNPFLGKSQDEVDAMLESNDKYYSDPNYADWYQEYAASQASDALDKTSSGSGAGLEHWVNNMFGWLSEGVDIKNKLDSGISSDSGGINTEIKAGGDVTKSSNTIYYIAGAVVVALIIVGIVVSQSKNK
jgi:hypothetical protein